MEEPIALQCKSAENASRTSFWIKAVNRNQLQLIIAGLTDGVILVEPDQSIAWANAAALAMHGVDTTEDLGKSVSEYRHNFQLQYRNNHHIEGG